MIKNIYLKHFTKKKKIAFAVNGVSETSTQWNDEGLFFTYCVRLTPV